MQYIKATEKDTDQIVALVQETIQTIYPKYYPKEVVDFFCELHCKENISQDVENGIVGVLQIDDVIIGTGCYKDNYKGVCKTGISRKRLWKLYYAVFRR